MAERSKGAAIATAAVVAAGLGLVAYAVTESELGKSVVSWLGGVGKKQPPRLSRQRVSNHAATWLSASAHPAFSCREIEGDYLDARSRNPSSDAYSAAVQVIDKDLPRTFPMEMFMKDPEFLGQLKNVLATYAAYDSPVSYVQGMNFIAAFILKHVKEMHLKQGHAVEVAKGADADEVVTFVLLTRLLSHPRYHLRDHFVHGMPGVEVTNFVLKALIREYVPAVYEHLEAAGCQPIYFFEWYFTLFTHILPLEVVAELWDAFFERGWAPVFQVILTLLRILEPMLLETPRGELSPVVVVLKSFQNHTNLMALGEAAASGGDMLRIPPPPALLSTAEEAFPLVTPEKVQGLREEAQRHGRHARIVAGAAAAQERGAALASHLMPVAEGGCSAGLSASWCVVEPGTGAGGGGTEGIS